MIETPPRSRLARIALLTLGWCLVALGIVGLFLPVLQGVLLIFAGLWVLSLESRTARRLLEKLRRRFPALDERFSRWRERMRERWRRLRKRR